MKPKKVITAPASAKPPAFLKLIMKVATAPRMTPARIEPPPIKNMAARVYTTREFFAKDRDMADTKTATFGAGCFWGIEAAFRRLDGVISATSGYMGGWIKNPTYQMVCTDATGHAEVV